MQAGKKTGTQFALKWSKKANLPLLEQDTDTTSCTPYAHSEWITYLFCVCFVCVPHHLSLHSIFTTRLAQTLHVRHKRERCLTNSSQYYTNTVCAKCLELSHTTPTLMFTPWQHACHARFDFLAKNATSAHMCHSICLSACLCQESKVNRKK